MLNFPINTGWVGVQLKQSALPCVYTTGDGLFAAAPVSHATQLPVPALSVGSYPLMMYVAKR